MKICHKLLFSALVTVMTGFYAHAQGDWNKERGKAMGQVTEASINTEISFLADTLCEGRATGTRGNVESAFWVARKFKKAGLLPLGESYSSQFTAPNGTIAHNIIGMLPGAFTIPRDRYVIVGAHFDHLGRLNGKVYPGADANASGTVVMTSLADMFGAMRTMGKVYDSSIIFVAFDAKEMNMAGSDALWKLIEYGMLKDPVSGKTISKEKISLMVNIDQIGSSLSPISKDRKDYLLMLGNESLKKDRQGDILICNQADGLGLDLCLSYYGSKTFTEVFYRLSDQKIFVDNRIPAVLFTSGITMNTNKTRDCAENLDIAVLKKRISLIYHWLERML